MQLHQVKNLMKNILCLLILAVALIVPHASYAEVKPASAQDIERAEKYLQDLKSAEARFVQTTHDGTQLVGTFYLKRPGKLRFEYDPPVESFVVADGLFIYFYDAELEEQSNAPIQTTLANFFLRKKFSLADDLMVKEAKHAGGLLQLTVVQAEDQDAGSIIFAFGEKPFELKKWRVIDPQGMITEVELFHLKKNVKHDSKLFVYIDPKKKDGKPRYND